MKRWSQHLKQSKKSSRHTTVCLQGVMRQWNTWIIRCARLRKTSGSPIFRIEIVDVMSAYVKLYRIGAKITDDEILGGMQTE